MRILYVGLLYNYGKPEEGYSYEHFNIEAGLKDQDQWYVDCLYPDNCKDLGRSAMDLVVDGNYDAIIHVAFNESLDFPENAAKLALKKDIPVLQWDCDSSWRFENWVKPRSNRVSHFITTHSATVPWYKDAGMNVIRSQWGGSPFYHTQHHKKSYDCSFIGQKHGQMPNGKFLRAEIIDAIMQAGISIELFGNYWNGYPNWHGYLADFRDMIEAFDRSKVCLNLSNPWHHGSMPQIKGRHFEIPQIGGFQICTPADDLLSYFKEDEEIVVGENVGDLIDKIQYYLSHDSEREAIAEAGHQRMLKEHQWSHRFQAIFQEIGLA